MKNVLRRSGWTFRAGRNATTIAPDEESVFTFDLEGRPLSWWENGAVYKRTLASEVHVRRRDGDDRERRRLAKDVAGAIFQRVLERIASAPAEDLDPEVRGRLDAILRWTADSLLAERKRFDAAYRPISILPPDQYLSIVLQATFGCSWNRCTFCDFYQDRPFTAPTPDAFAEHARAVRELLGRAAALRKSIFLADGNALILAGAKLRPIFEVAQGMFPGRPVSGFVDVVTGERKPVEDWDELRRIGLDRVQVGLETGHEPLLRWMNKPGDEASAIEFVATLKAAGLRVSAIFMVGVGGARFADAHVRDTLDLVSHLPLGHGDLVYLSPFVDHGDSEYSRRAAADGVAPLSAPAAAAQYARLRDAIRAMRPRTRVARYDIREFLY